MRIESKRCSVGGLVVRFGWPISSAPTVSVNITFHLSSVNISMTYTFSEQRQGKQGPE